MKKHKTLQEFKSKKEFVQYLVSNKQNIIKLKKLEIKKCDAIGLAETTTSKAIATNFKDDPASGSITRTVIGNTYLWLDSHDDVHIEGIFTKSLKENQSNIKHLHDHEYKLDSEVGEPISVYEKPVSWQDLGIDIKGKTTALWMDTNIIEKWNERVFDKYLKGRVQQHSVGMQYIQLDLAVNDPEMKAEFSEWNKHIHLIGNREKAEEQGYFWAVKEAKLVEISAVLAGSNELTPTVHNSVENESKEIPLQDNYWDKLAYALRA